MLICCNPIPYVCNKPSHWKPWALHFLTTDGELFQISSVEKRDRYPIVAGAAESADE